LNDPVVAGIAYGPALTPAWALTRAAMAAAATADRSAAAATKRGWATWTCGPTSGCRGGVRRSHPTCHHAEQRTAGSLQDSITAEPDASEILFLKILNQC
jgi:hypothetical protein